VSGSVQLLWFVRERKECEDTELLIGVYESEQLAQTAIERLRGQPGFAEYPQGFQICSYELNKDHWLEGFVRV